MCIFFATAVPIDIATPVMVFPLMGFGHEPKNNLNDLLHDSDVVGPWSGEGKDRQKDRKLIPAIRSD